MKIYTRDRWKPIGSSKNFLSRPLLAFKESRLNHIGMIKDGIVSRQPISFGGLKIRQYIVYHQLIENKVNRVKHKYASFQ